jgi:hypothetical protein
MQKSREEQRKKDRERKRERSKQKIGMVCKSARIIKSYRASRINHKKYSSNARRAGGGIVGDGAPAISAFFTSGRHLDLSRLTNDPTPNPASDKLDSRVRASAAAPHPAWTGSPRTAGNPRSTEKGSHRTKSCYVAADLAGARRSWGSIRMGVAFPARFSRCPESCPRHADGCLSVAAASRMRAWIQMQKEMGRPVRVRTRGWTWTQERVQVQ